MKHLFVVAATLALLMSCGKQSSTSATGPGQGPGTPPQKPPTEPELKFVDFTIPMEELKLKVKARYKENGHVEILEYPTRLDLPVGIVDVPTLASKDAVTPETCKAYWRRAVAFNSTLSIKDPETDLNYQWIRSTKPVLIRVPQPVFDTGSRVFQKALERASRDIPYAKQGNTIENGIEITNAWVEIDSDKGSLTDLVGHPLVLSNWFAERIGDPRAMGATSVNAELSARDLLCDLKTNSARVLIHLEGQITKGETKEKYKGLMVLSGIDS